MPPPPDLRAPILLLGATGQVGWELQRTLSPLGDVVSASRDGRYGPRLDLQDRDGLAALLGSVRPRCLVNAAAYTAVDRAETERARALRINADAPAWIGELAAATGIPVVHYSTDFVFSGAGRRPYREEDPTAPLNVYGETKLAGERRLLETGAEAVVLRTSWVYGARGGNFLLTMLKLFRTRDELGVVDDQVGAPTWSRMIAEATASIVHRMLERRGTLRGIYHLSAAGETSWYGFAHEILERSELECRLRAIGTDNYPTPATRPAYSVLDNSKTLAAFGIALPHWRHSLGQCLEETAVA